MNRTNHRLHCNPYYEAALTEHQELLHLLGPACEAMQSSEVLWPETLQRLQALHDALNDYCLREAEGGYLEESILRKPSLVQEAGEIQKQRVAMRNSVAELVREARRAVMPQLARPVLCNRLEHLVRLAAAQMQTECRFLDRAFNEDMGTEL